MRDFVFPGMVKFTATSGKGRKVTGSKPVLRERWFLPEKVSNCGELISPERLGRTLRALRVSGAAPLQEGVVVCVLEARAHMRFCGRVCGVVKARATSHQRLRVRIPPAAKAAVAQW